MLLLWVQSYAFFPNTQQKSALFSLFPAHSFMFDLRVVCSSVLRAVQTFAPRCPFRLFRLTVRSVLYASLFVPSFAPRCPFRPLCLAFCSVFYVSLPVPSFMQRLYRCPLPLQAPSLSMPPFRSTSLRLRLPAVGSTDASCHAYYTQRAERIYAKG